jgi:DNA-binding LacI/PurR family transcriptional regulator
LEALTLHCNGPRVKEAEIKKTIQQTDGGRPLPTIAEVARLATVSTATVSRVVNGSPNVRPATREAVLAAIEQLGYTPNRAARTLVTRRTDTIALVVSESETRVFSDPFFPSIVRGISAALAQTELQLLLLMARDDREHAKVERYVRQGHVDGVILMSLHGDDPLPKTLPRLGVPTVLVGRPRRDERLPWVDADNRGGARAATAHLLARGRKNVATITGPLDMTVGVDRFDGYRDALREAGRRFRKVLVAHGDFGKESGAHAVRALAERAPDMDAVFVANDPMAIGALEALRSLGRRVPDDVAVIGFDDIADAALTDPPLTTVSQPLEEMTKALAELLLQRMNGLGDEDESVVCATHLVTRGSA